LGNYGGAGSLTLRVLQLGRGPVTAGGIPVQPISFKRHRFPADVIRQAVWRYFRFTLSLRDVEKLLAQRGIEVSREARPTLRQFRAVAQQAWADATAAA